jgi:predicted glycoside hydrolase/deacetylase ChbG (UPF0249 family)
MRIITNADDFGMDADTVQATIECLEAGALTGATIMPSMPATAQAVQYAAAHPEKSFGVHLTYITDTVEAPLCAAATLPTLATPEGKFFPSQRVRWRALRGQLSVDDIERETAAQIQRLIDLGVRPSHVDSHGHLHKFKPFRLAPQKVLPRFGIHKIRNVQNVYLRKPLKSPTYWLGPLWRRKIMKLFTTTDNFFMPISEQMDMTWPAALLARVRSTLSLEVGVHPGHAEAWRGCERRAICDFAQAARAAGHQLVGWKDL